MPRIFSSKRAFVLLFISLFLIGGGILGASAYYLFHPAKKTGHKQVFFVKEGATLREVASNLEREGFINSEQLFLIWAKLTKKSRRIKAGEYHLNPNMPPVEILETLIRGAVITHPLTIPEGFSVEQIAALLSQKGLADKAAFLSLAGDPDLAKSYGINGSSVEGYLYPDTYYFARGLSPASIIGVMVKRFEEVFEPFRKRTEALGMTVADVITLASIVEKETGLKEERPLIASVFLNRLKKKMRLESDPTVIYGMRRFDGNLTRDHLSMPTPYNTYVIQGLPPGPISNPGEEAIKAVLYPARTDYLYFVSKNDGSHYFSETLAEHNRAVDYYQKRKRRGG